MNVLDIISIILIIVFAVTGYRKGLMKTVVSAVGTLLCSLISSVLSKPIAEAIYNGFLKTTIIEKIDSAIKLTAREGGSLVDNLIKSLPNFVGNSLAGFNISAADIASSASKSGSAQVEKIIAPIVISFFSVIVAAVLFSVLLVVVKIVTKMICNSMSDSPLGMLDSVAGGAVSIIEAFVILMVAAFVLRMATPHMAVVPKPISEKSISESTVFKGVYNSPIIIGLVSSVTDSPNTEKVE